jgi:hypothetical protein
MWNICWRVWNRNTESKAEHILSCRMRSLLNDFCKNNIWQRSQKNNFPLEINYTDVSRYCLKKKLKDLLFCIEVYRYMIHVCTQIHATCTYEQRYMLHVCTEIHDTCMCTDTCYMYEQRYMLHVCTEIHDTCMCTDTWYMYAHRYMLHVCMCTDTC